MKRAAAGFTLLEVLIALTVLALSLGAVIQASGDFTSNQIYLRDRTFAEWVARNQLVATQLQGGWPSLGRKKGEVDFPQSTTETAGREWRWEMQVTQTPEEDMRRVDIEVFLAASGDDDSPLATLSGFIGKPVE